MLHRYRTKFLSAISMAMLLFTYSHAYRPGTTALCHTAVYKSANESEVKNSADAKEVAICELACRLELPIDDIKNFLRVNDRCRLVPLMASEEHRNCLIDIFSRASKDYMKYYLSGRILSPKRTDEIFYKGSLSKLWKTPAVRSITFIIEYDGNSVGRIGIGPITNRGAISCELGYAIKQDYSGKHIVSSCVKAVLNFLKYMVTRSPEKYDFKELIATAHKDNGASNHILSKLGFNMVPNRGIENKYVYSLKE